MFSYSYLHRCSPAFALSLCSIAQAETKGEIDVSMNSDVGHGCDYLPPHGSRRVRQGINYVVVSVGEQRYLDLVFFPHPYQQQYHHVSPAVIAHFHDGDDAGPVQ